MTIIGRIALLVDVNLAWLLCSWPVITGGAAMTALYTVLLERDELTYDIAFKRFFQIFVKRFKKTLPLWLWSLAVIGCLSGAWLSALRMELTNQFTLMLPLLLVSVAASFTLLWLYPLLAAGETLGLAVIRTAFLLGLRELWRSLGLLALEALAVFLCLWCLSTTWTLRGIWFLFGYVPIACVKLLLMGAPLRKHRC